MIKDDLKCLRCSARMERGTITSIDAPNISTWSLYDPEVATLKGVTLLRGEKGIRVKEALARIKVSRATVYAYRCPSCGYVELNAQLNSESVQPDIQANQP